MNSKQSLSFNQLFWIGLLFWLNSEVIQNWNSVILSWGGCIACQANRSFWIKESPSKIFIFGQQEFSLHLKLSLYCAVRHKKFLSYLHLHGYQKTCYFRTLITLCNVPPTTFTLISVFNLPGTTPHYVSFFKGVLTTRCLCCLLQGLLTVHPQLNSPTFWWGLNCKITK